MIVARSLGELPAVQNSVVTVGTFDGVHAGHRAILGELTMRAAASGGRSVVITFHPHPRTVVGRADVGQLCSLEERLGQIGRLGVDAALVLEFTYEFSRQTPREFCLRYLIRGVGVREVVIGYDHMFGRDREAGLRELRGLGTEFGFGVRVVDPVSIEGGVVSSSRIRELLLQGDVERAATCLGRPYSAPGTVVKGDGRGTQVGFPTANIRPEMEQQILPADGVYFVSVDLEGEQAYGMSNIGVRPTFETDGKRTIEVHLFEHRGELYGRKLTLYFLKRLRGEKKFASAGDLVRQLNADRDACMKQIAAHQLQSS
jgi:riboflavin kinase / FMN adenylyltransferase